MSHITASHLKHFLDIDIAHNDLVEYLEIIVQLQKKYGKTLYDPKVLGIIKDLSIETYVLLHETKAFNHKDIRTLINQIKTQSPDYIPTFVIHTPKDKYKDALTHKVNTQFSQCHIQSQEDINLGVAISGEGRYYKRNIDQDIQKLLD